MFIKSFFQLTDKLWFIKITVDSSNISIKEKRSVHRGLVRYFKICWTAEWYFDLVLNCVAIQRFDSISWALLCFGDCLLNRRFNWEFLSGNFNTELSWNFKTKPRDMINADTSNTAQREAMIHVDEKQAKQVTRRIWREAKLFETQFWLFLFLSLCTVSAIFFFLATLVMIDFLW